MIKSSDIKLAKTNLSELVNPTPVKRSYFLEELVNCKVHLKLENLNLSGSFKIRGAANALMNLTADQLSHGIVAASAGNHAQGVAHTCKRLGIPATIFMPARTPVVKAEATRNLGATIHLSGESYDDAYIAAREFEIDTKAKFIHAFDNPSVIAGQGTVGLELLEQIPDLTTVIVPIGGGGLISGIACACKEANPKIQIIGVQTEAYPSVYNSRRQGKIVPSKAARTIADGIAVKQPSQLTFSMIQRYVDDIILITEDEIADTLLALMENDHLLAEGCGAVAAAGLLKLTKSHSSLLLAPSDSVACIVSGGNIDTNLLQRITSRGLFRSGRAMRLSCTIEDRPGKLVQFLTILSSQGANLIEVDHNRLFGMSYLDEVKIDVDLETIDRKHQQKILHALTTSGFSVQTKI